MANAKQRRAAQRGPQSAKAFVTGDSFTNFAARVGLGTGNQAADGRYSTDFISRNRLLLENAYRSSWICGQAVDAVAEDMTRAGVVIQSDIEPDEVETLERSMVSLRIWDELCDTIKWARLYGGAIAVMLVDGQKMDTPLMPDRISEGQFKGLLVLDRWQIEPTLNLVVREFGPDMGMPEFYTVLPGARAMAGEKIHHSRVIRLDGAQLPHWQRISENGWGQSELERLWDRLLAFDSTTQGAAQLVYKAHLRTISIEGLRELIAMGGKPYEAMLQQIELIRRYQSNEGMTMLDAKDKFEAHSYTFSGLDSVLMQFSEQISGGAADPADPPVWAVSGWLQHWRQRHPQLLRQGRHAAGPKAAQRPDAPVQGLAPLGAGPRHGRGFHLRVLAAVAALRCREGDRGQQPDGGRRGGRGCWDR